MSLQLRSKRLLLLGVTIAASVVLVGACAAAGATLRPAADSVATPAPAAGGAQAAVGAPVPALGVNSAPPGAAPAVGVAQAAPAIAPAPAPALASSSAGVVAQVAPPAPYPAPAPSRGIAVSGTGTVTVAPDQAIVSAGVQTRGQTAQAAQSDNNQRMAAVLAAIKALGIQPKDIQTSGISLYPIDTQNQTVNGYSATNNVTIVVQDVDLTGQVLDAAVKAGANQSISVRFSIKNKTDLRNKALAAAAADARQKADALAGALGLKISGIESVSEQSVGGPIVTGPRAFGATAAAAPSVPIEPGELTVNAQVTVVFGY